MIGLKNLNKSWLNYLLKWKVLKKSETFGTKNLKINPFNFILLPTVNQSEKLSILLLINQTNKKIKLK